MVDDAGRGTQGADAFAAGADTDDAGRSETETETGQRQDIDTNTNRDKTEAHLFCQGIHKRLQLWAPWIRLHCLPHATVLSLPHLQHTAQNSPTVERGQ